MIPCLLDLLLILVLSIKFVFLLNYQDRVTFENMMSCEISLNTDSCKLS